MRVTFDVEGQTLGVDCRNLWSKSSGFLHLEMGLEFVDPSTELLFSLHRIAQVAQKAA